MLARLCALLSSSRTHPDFLPLGLASDGHPFLFPVHTSPGWLVGLPPPILPSCFGCSPCPSALSPAVCLLSMTGLGQAFTLPEEIQACVLERGMLYPRGYACVLCPHLPVLGFQGFKVLGPQHFLNPNLYRLKESRHTLFSQCADSNSLYCGPVSSRTG